MADEEIATSAPDFLDQQEAIPNGGNELTEQQEDDTVDEQHANTTVETDQEAESLDQATDMTDRGNSAKRRLSDELMAAARAMPRRKSNLKQPGGEPGLSLKQVSFVHKGSSRNLLNITSRECCCNSIHIERARWLHSLVDPRTSYANQHEIPRPLSQLPGRWPVAVATYRVISSRLALLALDSFSTGCTMASASQVENGALHPRRRDVLSRNEQRCLMSCVCSARELCFHCLMLHTSSYSFLA